MKKILVTGGSGFIGSNLCHKLVLDGHYVVALDNNYTGRIENVQDLFNCNNFCFVEADVKNKISLSYDFDEIYNLACPASPPAYQGEHSIDTTLTCVLGAKNILDFAVKCNAKVLQASTSEVYGDPTITPQNENYRGNVNPNGIRACYDEGKRCAESLFFDYYRHKKARIKIIRIFNTYGPYMDPNDGRVISNFICQALLGKDITIYGEGKQTRSFCFIDDLITGMIKMMETDDFIQGPINLGNPQEFTILELANLVLNKINSKSKIIFCDLPLDDPKQRCPDITKAMETINWIPQIPLNEGLSLTIDYFKKCVYLFK